MSNLGFAQKIPNATYATKTFCVACKSWYTATAAMSLGSSSLGSNSCVGLDLSGGHHQQLAPGWSDAEAQSGGRLSGRLLLTSAPFDDNLTSATRRILATCELVFSEFAVGLARRVGGCTSHGCTVGEPTGERL